MSIRKISRTLLWLLIGSTTLILIWNSRFFLFAPAQSPFVQERAGEVPVWWLPLLVAHVLAGMAVLISGPMLFLPLSTRFGRLHGWLGPVYALAAVGILLPTGLVLSFTAHGGWIGRLGFFLTGLWMMFYTVQGLRTLQQKRFPAHRAWMLRSYAMACSALTFRALYVGAYLLGMPYPLNYPLSTWLSTLLNLLIAEVLLHSLPIFHTTPHQGLLHENPDPADARLHSLLHPSR